MVDDLPTPPHCDQAVLHSPGECGYCDAHPDWQQYRRLAGIAFTGHPPAKHEVPCPSDQRRPGGVNQVWPGNRPAPSGQPPPPYAPAVALGVDEELPQCMGAGLDPDRPWVGSRVWFQPENSRTHVPAIVAATTRETLGLADAAGWMRAAEIPMLSSATHVHLTVFWPPGWPHPPVERIPNVPFHNGPGGWCWPPGWVRPPSV